MKKSIFSLLAGLIFSIIILEIACIILVKTSYIPARIPSYSLDEVSQPFAFDLDPNFGVWHQPNDTTRQKRACYDVTYISNKYGARDKERAYNSEFSRVVVLGDSFVEGWGVNLEDRFTDVLEENSGKEHLNFGSSGTMGPTQYYLLYKHLASQFDHDNVLVAILPDNDFKDDYPFDPTRYRPYWEGQYPDYELKYTIENIQDSRWYPSRFHTEMNFSEFLRRFTYFQNVYDWIEAVIYQRQKESQTGENIIYSGYYDYSKEELNRMVYSLLKIRELAMGKEMAVLLLPRYNDLLRFKESRESPLFENLSAVLSDEGVQVFDLLPEFFIKHEDDLYSLFLPCDGHWSPQGHLEAAELIEERLKGNFY